VNALDLFIGEQLGRDATPALTRAKASIPRTIALHL
jgi:hypothetical protein